MDKNYTKETFENDVNEVIECVADEFLRVPSLEKDVAEKLSNMTRRIKGFDLSTKVNFLRRLEQKLSDSLRNMGDE